MKKLIVEFIINDETEKLIQDCADQQGMEYEEAIEELMGDEQLGFDDMMAIDWKIVTERQVQSEVSGV